MADCAQILADIKLYESLVASYKASLAANPDVHSQAHQDLLNGLASATQSLSAFYTEYAQHCVHPPVKPPQFQAGSWELVSPYGIQIEGDAWLTGSVWSVLPLPESRALLGSEQGGLWLSEPDGHGSYTSRCLSNDWRHWKVSALVADPANAANVFAGCAEGPSPGGLYHGSAAPPDFGPWSEISLPWRMGDAVNAMVILPQQRILVVASDAGLGWFGIDSPTYEWYSTAGGIADIALTRSGQPIVEGEEFVYLTRRKSTPAFTVAPQILRASILGSTMNPPAPPDSISWQKAPSQFEPLRVASCRQKPETVYCLGLCPKLDGLSGGTGIFILRSDDGGRTWTECPYSHAVVQQLANDLYYLGTEVKSPRSIAVHPSLPDTIAVGYGQVALSNDGGKTWTYLTSDNAPGTHADIHNLHFDDGGDLWIPSDGGILHWSSIAIPMGFPPTLQHVRDSKRNQTLPIHMFYAPANSSQYGSLAACAGFVATGTQDNANVWLAPGDAAFRELERGDGGAVALYRDARDILVLYAKNFNQKPVKWGVWNGTDWGNPSVVPLQMGDSVDASGLIPVMRAVPPGLGLVAGPFLSPVMALAVGPVLKLPFGLPNTIFNRAIYGAIDRTFNLPNVTIRGVEWIELCHLVEFEILSAVEPYDANHVLGGTQSGRLFLFSVPGGPTEFTFDPLDTSGVIGIASDGRTVVCLKDSGVFVGQPGAPLKRLDAGIFPPNGYASVRLRGACANRNQKYLRLSFAVTIAEGEVWVSNSPIGAVWHKVTDGLPANVRCSDVVFRETAVSGELLLSTYGRSLWRLSFT